MFDNIASLRFHRGPGSEMMATAMVSAEGETMDFRHNVPAFYILDVWQYSIVAVPPRSRQWNDGHSDGLRGGRDDGLPL